MTAEYAKIRASSAQALAYERAMRQVLCDGRRCDADVFRTALSGDDWSQVAEDVGVGLEHLELEAERIPWRQDEDARGGAKRLVALDLARARQALASGVPHGAVAALASVVSILLRRQA